MQINKLSKRQSTKAERKFMELLKQNHIKFLYKQKVGGREIDFIIGKYAIEIDGHKQDSSKNEMLAERGFIPIHYENNEIKNIKKCLSQIFQTE